jgi:hypothetical protein
MLPDPEFITRKDKGELQVERKMVHWLDLAH